MHTELGTCPIFIGKGRLERPIRLHILSPVDVELDGARLGT